MKGARTGRTWLAALVCATLVTGFAACSDDPEPVYQDDTAPQAVVREYDASLEPSAAVLSLVPAGATSLTVTDFDQLRLVLGFGSLDSASPPEERETFWRRAGRTATLSLGLLRDVDEQLRADFGFSRDDVAWEASWEGEQSGWALAFHDSVPMRAVQRAVRAGVGPLRGAVVDADRHLVTSARPPAGDQSWGAVPEMAALTGREAISTFVDRSCRDFDDVFGDGMEASLAKAPKAALRAIDELEAWSVALGAELVTVQLGPDRGDAFDRVRLADVMPRTDPDFGTVMDRGVADPSSGRLGYTLRDPRGAAELTKARQLPFAVCRSLG